MSRAKAKNVKHDDNRSGAQGQVPIREFDKDAVAEELRQRVGSVNTAVQKLEKAQLVTQEALNLEFSI